MAKAKHFYIDVPDLVKLLSKTLEPKQKVVFARLNQKQLLLLELMISGGCQHMCYLLDMEYDVKTKD